MITLRNNILTTDFKDSGNGEIPHDDLQSLLAKMTNELSLGSRGESRNTEEKAS